MGGRHLLHVYNSSHAYRMKRLTAYIPMSVKRYSEGKKVHGDHEQEHVHEERAPSTAEEFRRVAEEKSHRDAAASDHHTAEEKEGSEETTTSDSDVESVEEKILNEPSSVGPTS